MTFPASFIRALVVWLLLCGWTVATPGSDVRQLPNPAVADVKAYASFPDAMRAMAASRLPSDGSGLIGRNRTWGALYSPRFQLGAGSALRTALVARRLDKAALAFRAIEVGVEIVQSDGSVPSSVPDEAGDSLSAADIASAAAFFLGDACLGLLAVEAAARPAAVASDDRRAEVRAGLVRAVEWLLAQQDVLMAVDGSAPNRLLFDARSFQACGSLSTNSELRSAAERAAVSFVEAALRLHADDGHFVEGGGHDTSYQGVALRVGEDVLLAGYPDPDGRFRSALTSAADWLAARVGPEGRIDSSGNTRTCGGGETWFGKPKRIAVPDVFAGLVYTGVRTGRHSLAGAARRIEVWLHANPQADPCS